MIDLSVKIPENKLYFFLELMKSLNFVDINNENNDYNLVDIPEFHKKIIDQRLKKYYENPQDTEDWEDVKREIESQL